MMLSAKIVLLSSCWIALCLLQMRPYWRRKLGSLGYMMLASWIYAAVGIPFSLALLEQKVSIPISNFALFAIPGILILFAIFQRRTEYEKPDPLFMASMQELMTYAEQELKSVLTQKQNKFEEADFGVRNQFWKYPDTKLAFCSRIRKDQDEILLCLHLESGINENMESEPEALVNLVVAAKQGNREGRFNLGTAIDHLGIKSLVAQIASELTSGKIHLDTQENDSLVVAIGKKIVKIRTRPSWVQPTQVPWKKFPTTKLG